MLLQRQYNKIIHDWLVLLTSLPGGNVRPQKNEFGFALVDATGKPIAFDSMICMFYIGFDDRNIDMYFKDVDTVQSLKNASVTVTFIGEQADQYLNTIQSLAFSNASLTYLRKFKFALEGQPREVINDKEYSEKWFYRRTIIFTLNTVFEFVPNNTPIESDIIEAPIYINYEDPEREYIAYLQNLIDTKGTFGNEFSSKHITDFSFLSKLDAKNLTELNSAFFENDMTTIPYINTKNVYNFDGAFMLCENLEELPNLDFSSATWATNTFHGCKNLKKIPDTLDFNKIESCSWMFLYCSSLEELPELDFSTVIDMREMFFGCSNLKTIKKLTLNTDMKGSTYGDPFGKCNSLTNINLINIKRTLSLSDCSLLTEESLINTIQQIWDYSGTDINCSLILGNVNMDKLANIYVREVSPDLSWIERDPNIIYKKPFEVCQSTDEGAILILDYAKTKNWTIK